MRTVLLLVSALWLSATHLPAAEISSPTASAWPREAEGILTDPTITWGTLPNGLRYAIKRQPHPVGTASLRMLVLAGSLHENDDERGVAHFVEHMAFNGTRKFRGESLSAELEKAGIRFGPDVTAFTWPSHTIYHLDLPSAAPEKLDLAFSVLREWGSELLFQRREVERERGVLISEFRTRGQNAHALYQNRLNFLYPESLLSRRIVSGTPEEIEKTPRDHLIAFYQRWYRPDNVILVAAGDFAPADIAARIAAHFADWERPADPLPSLELGTIRNQPSTQAKLVVNEEVKSFVAELALVASRDPATADTLTTRRRGLALQLALAALQRRFELIARAQPGTFGNLGVNLNSPTPFNEELVFYAESKPDNWPLLASTLLDEYRRLRIYGFTTEELAAPRDNLLRGNEYATRHGDTEPAVNFAARLASTLLWGNQPTAPAFNYAFASEHLPAITPEECLDALRPFFAEGFPGMQLTSASAAMLTADEVATHINAVITRELSPPTATERIDFPYTDFGPPGEVVTRRHDESLDVHMLEFANGLKLNLKRTTFTADSVFLTVRLDNGGQLAEPRGMHGVAALAQSVLPSGGLNQLPAEQLAGALAGHFVRLSFDINASTMSFNGSADVEELNLLLQLLTAYLTDAAMDDESFATAREGIRSWSATALLDAQRAVGSFSADVFYQEDDRFTLIPPEQLDQLNAQMVRAWISNRLDRAPMEIGLVGDFDLETAIAAVASTLGTLPPAKEPAALDRLPPFNLERGAALRFLPVQSGEPQASLLFAWPVDAVGEARRRRTLEILSHVLGNRVLEDIRENLGATYAPSVSYWTSEVYPEQGYLQASITVAPADVAEAQKHLTKIAQRLAKRGIKREELERAKAPLIDGVDAQLNSNGYWIRHVVSAAQTNPEALQLPHTRLSDLQSISEKEVERLAREVLSTRQFIRILAIPPGTRLE
ncbi:M16 family metallopeptidase [Actomonas aquatica]|uniref:Insulinase family protein n=1 Tax=Actomonas aquatica TaxID=2866162 RepID=A0ABZ1C7S6_9BACT|nr:insulinase family protein [Opitutus sp. WL0086]WRQ87467.1 insulinase family protein [Opitutus sp. WL0086]